MKILRVILLVLTALMVSSCYTVAYRPTPKAWIVPRAYAMCGTYRMVEQNWFGYYQLVYMDDCGRLWYPIWPHPKNGYRYREPIYVPLHREPIRSVRPEQPRQPDRRPEVRQPESRRPEFRQPEPRQPETRRPEPRQPEARPQQPQNPSNPPSSGRRRSDG